MRNLLKVGLVFASTFASGSVMAAQVVISGSDCQPATPTMASQLSRSIIYGITNTSTSATATVLCPFPNAVTATAGAAVGVSMDYSATTLSGFTCTYTRQYGFGPSFPPPATTPNNSTFNTWTWGTIYTYPVDSLVLSCTIPKNSAAYIRSIRFTW